MAQLPTESVDQFITKLRERAEYCEFDNAKDENIRDEVIEKCLSSRLRRKLLDKGGGLTLKQLQNTARSMEASDRQAGAIENPNDKEYNPLTVYYLNGIFGSFFWTNGTAFFSTEETK